MARYPSEEFYGAPSNVTQPVINQRSPAEEAYLQSIGIMNRDQDRRAGMKDQSVQSDVAMEKSFGDSMSQAISDTPKNFIEAKKLSDDSGFRRAADQRLSEEHKMTMESKQRELDRDEKYGDEMAKSKMEREKAGVESTRAGTEATKFSTTRGEKLLSGETQGQELQNRQMAANIDQAPLIKKQLAVSIEAAGLQNEDMRTKTASSNVAAIIANARSAGRSPQESDQLASQAVQQIRASGQYDDATIQKGNRLATTEGFQDASMRQFITQSDPQFQQAQKLRERMTASATVMTSLKAELSKLENDNTLFDSPASKQAMDNIAAQLDNAGQSKLANSLRQNTAEAFMTPGSPTTKLERAKQAVLAVSQSLKNELGASAQMAGSNPHLSPQILQPIWQAVNYNPSQPLQAPNLFQGVGGPNIVPVSGQPGVGAGNFVTPPGMAMPPQGGQGAAPPPVDLFVLPGAQRKAMPVPPPKGR